MDSGPFRQGGTVTRRLMFTVLRDFRRLTDAILRLVEGVLQLRRSLDSLVQIQQEAGPTLERLEALELARHQFEAEVQGTLLEAKGKLKASLNAEARERQLKKHNERLADPLADDGEEPTEAGEVLLPLDAKIREEERLSTLRLGVAPDRKAAAVNAKWSR